jgi:hypothetical protein
VPLGSELGVLRGIAAALLASLSTAASAASAGQLEEARTINSALSAIRLSDIAPPDLEAEAHAREHHARTGEPDEDMDVLDGPLKDKADAEMLEDMFNTLSTSTTATKSARPTNADVHVLRARLETLCLSMGVTPDFS